MRSVRWLGCCVCNVLKRMGSSEERGGRWGFLGENFTKKRLEFSFSMKDMRKIILHKNANLG